MKLTKMLSFACAVLPALVFCSALTLHTPSTADASPLAAAASQARQSAAPVASVTVVGHRMTSVEKAAYDMNVSK